jgi:UDP-N-acetylmuramoyl-tripeptide--D-alanyl-D-alanine ligase
MWPLSAREVMLACGWDSDSAPPLDGVSIAGATGSLHDLEPGDLFVALHFADGDAHAWAGEALAAGAGLALVSERWPGLATLAPAQRARCVPVADVLAAFRKLAAVFRQRCSYPVVAIAGSNGKTTTKDMLSALLGGPGARVEKTPGTDNGYIGLPRTLCARTHRSDAPLHAVVLEIGIDARGAMSEHVRMAAPDVAVITALGPEHLDGLGDVETAVSEELRLFEDAPQARRVVPLWEPELQKRPELLRARDVAVVDNRHPGAQAAGLRHAGARLAFDHASRGEDSDLQWKWYPVGDGAGPAWEGELRVPMPGAHNARSCALAVAAALKLGRAPDQIVLGWETFVPPPWRSQVLRLARGALLYNDCFNASPLSMAAALAALGDPAWAGRPKIAILGDMLELGAESSQLHLALQGQLEAVAGLQLFLFGPEMVALGERLRAAGGAARVLRSGSAPGDPAALVSDLELPANAVVLVKGSRGMRMARGTRDLQRRWGTEAPAAQAGSKAVVPAVFVTGSYDTGVTTTMVSAALAVMQGHLTAVEVPHESLAALAAKNEHAVGIFTGLTEADLPEGGDPETHLAQKARMFMGGSRLRAAVLHADDPASDLMAEVIPPGVRILRYGTTGAASGRVDLLATAIEITPDGTRVVLERSPDFPEVLQLEGRGTEFARGAMAALLVVFALGGSPRKAAELLGIRVAKRAF